MITPAFRRQWLVFGIAAMVLTGFVLLQTHDSSAQTKKDKTKTKEKDKDKDKTETKKEAKLEPPPATFPKRTDQVTGEQGIAAHVTLIDEHITKGWKENKTFPSERCTDFEFIRRASLDILGRIPTVDEIQKFMKHPESTRRSWLINEMLDGPTYGNGAEYANYFATLWTIHLITRTGSNQNHKDQLQDWLYTQFKGNPGAGTSSKSSSTEQGGDENPKSKPKRPQPKNPDWSYTASQLIAAEGDTNSDNAAVNFLLHNLGEQIMTDQEKNGKWDMVPATSRTTRLFLGVRTQCVQCHDHPFNGDLFQRDFWGINAFLRQANSNGRPNPDAVKKKQKGAKGNQQYTLTDNPSFNKSGLIAFERRNAVLLFTDARFFDDAKKIPKKWQGTRREALAKYITESPYFAKAFVNRMWSHFMGKSFTKDNADDFGEHNPVSHPELFDKMSEDWAKNYGHNPKTLIRWICNSQAYGLSSRANKWNDKTDDETLFARMLLKPMSPEQMFESMMIATGSPYSNKDKETRAARLEKRDQWFSKLVVNFGNDEGEEGVYTGTVVQALLLMNGQDINAAITAKDPKEGAVAAIAQKRGTSYASLKLAINDMYMQVLNRPPSPQEMKDLTSPIYFNFRPGSKTQPTTPEFWRHYYEDIMWALLNSNEFVLNH